MNENTNDTNMSEGGYRPSRRTMLAAAAWSVPVIVVAQAAPALASVSNPVFFTLSGACKLPGNSNDFLKGYAFGLTLVNSLGVNTTVYISQMKVDNVFNTIGLVEEWFSPDTCGTQQGVNQWGDPTPPGTPPTPPVGPIVVTNNASRSLAVFTVDAKASPSTTLEVFYSYTDENGVPTGTSSLISFVGSPWNGGCRPFQPDKGQDTWTLPTCTQF